MVRIKNFSRFFVLTLIAAISIASRLSAQAAGQQAGTVSAAIPDEVVKRQEQESPLKLTDPVYWEDSVHTLRLGRVRIALLDGSFLNVGARSTMHITRHDPRTQQTVIDLTLGKLRSKVVRLTEAGAYFQVTTPTAVIGVVGTDFIADTDGQDITTVYVIENEVHVRNVDPDVHGQVTVRAGERTIVRRGQPPTPPEPAPSAELQKEIDETNVGSIAPGESAPPAEPAARKEKPGSKPHHGKLVLAGVLIGIGVVVAVVIATHHSNTRGGYGGS